MVDQATKKLVTGRLGSVRLRDKSKEAKRCQEVVTTCGDKVCRMANATQNCYLRRTCTLIRAWIIRRNGHWLCSRTTSNHGQLLDFEISQYTRDDSTEEMTIRLRAGDIRIYYMARYAHADGLLSLQAGQQEIGEQACLKWRVS